MRLLEVRLGHAGDVVPERRPVGVVGVIDLAHGGDGLGEIPAERGLGGEDGLRLAGCPPLPHVLGRMLSWLTSRTTTVRVPSAPAAGCCRPGRLRAAVGRRLLHAEDEARREVQGGQW